MVIVSPYDRAWPDRFTEVEHVGSTSVPGLVAKPIIDIAALAPDLGTVPPDLFDGWEE
jgi:GrpB-like predicted nucleotidyltransferase (UPF0157 family)